MSDDLARLVHGLAELERRVSNMVRHGTVHEIKQGMVRIKMGEGEKGVPFLSPWLPQGDTHYGNVREEQPFKVGQNVTMLCPGGDPNQATLWPFSPNKENKRPDHATDDKHTYQFGDLKLERDGEHYHIQHGDRTHIRVHKSGGVTARVDQSRVAAHAQGAKMRVGTHWAVVSAAAPHLRCSELWEIASDPIPNDDGHITDTQQQDQGGEPPPPAQDGGGNAEELVAAEAAARVAADTAETSARIVAIAAEVAARADAIADEALERATALAAEAATREAADNATNAALFNETTSRIAGDSTNATAIAAEATTRATAITLEATTRATAVSNEAAARASADSAITTSIGNTSTDFVALFEAALV